jgi:hypothetical protein
MSKEFETLLQPLIEIIRRKQMPNVRTFTNLETKQSQNTTNSFNNANNFGTTLQDMELFLRSCGQKFCDVTLTLESVEISGLKAVLAARCSLR